MSGLSLPDQAHNRDCLSSKQGQRFRRILQLIPKFNSMEEYHASDEGSFGLDDASNSVKECIENVLGGVDYSQNKVNQWMASIVEQALTMLVKQGKPFKYIVNCTVMQKSGAGLHMANSCYWDTVADGSCTVRWENRTMYCVVSVFAVAMNP